MQKLLEYITDVLNIKATSEYMIQDMMEDISKVKDIVAYRSYIKKFVFSESVEKTSGIQKFIVLTREYLALEKASLKRLGIESKDTSKTIEPYADLDNRLKEMTQHLLKGNK